MAFWRLASCVCLIATGVAFAGSSLANWGVATIPNSEVFSVNDLLVSLAIPDQESCILGIIGITTVLTAGWIRRRTARSHARN